MSDASSNAASRPLVQRLAAYGCTDIIRLDEKLSAPTQLDYLDLLPKRSDSAPALTAVAEHQGTALLYLVDACGEAKSDARSLAEVRRALANRSDPAWLGVVRTGSLEIFPIGFHESANAPPVKTIRADEPTSPLFFQSLVHGTFEENHRLRGTDYVFKEIFGLLTQMTDTLVPTEGEDRRERALEILSMAGRALFFRFLIDRGIVWESELRGRDGICSEASELKDAFSSPGKAARTSAWLDETFNGDFLPLIADSIPATQRKDAYLRFYEDASQGFGKGLFSYLEAILRGMRAVGMNFQGELDWGDLDFAHIPVGVLSQVYESFSHRADPRTARDTSVHYTPRTIAGLMVEQSFAALQDKAAGQVLDSSCGAGIFLVLAFRRLVRERWQHDEERPRTTVIQDILYRQVCGFDVSEPALRLAALALYITAIEVNGSPRPPHALKFPRNLRGEVLHRFGSDADDTKQATAFSLGSLGPDVSLDFNGRFDIVIGNPPWTRLREKAGEEDDQDESDGQSKTDELNNAFTAIGRRVLTARGFPDLAKKYRNPDKNPDLPFLWRATEWAKQKGVIALALHPRLFMRITGKGYEVWRTVLRSVEVTGILNGADLRKTGVWEGMDAPFCLVFCRNSVPPSASRFHYATPLNEPGLNIEGRFRIDYETAQPVSVARVECQPWVLKLLSLGTWLDVEVMEGILKAFPKTLKQEWAKWNPKQNQNGQGYNLSTNVPMKAVGFLGEMLDFEEPTSGFSIEYSKLTTFKERHRRTTANRPRTESLYQKPLVIIPKAPGEDPLTPKAYLSSRALAFSQSYYGYSTAGHADETTLAALIYLLAHSTLFRYFALVVSASQGVDYMLFAKRDFAALPFPELDKLPTSAKTRIRNLAHRLEHNATKPWGEINEFIFSLYGLDADAVQVATDTLFAAASYRKAGRAALDRTTRDTRAEFIAALQDALEPYFDVCGEHAAVREAEFQPDTWREPWFFLTISRAADAVRVNPSLLREAMRVANERGASRIIVHAPGGHGLLLGLLNQQRWWTRTRARLCAQHIIRERLGAFSLTEEA
jgi:hypothetical protein